ncbi:MAG: cell envelope integrity protein CreD [Desulfuromonadales bacterium]|nr:cell envelope integrity protein CreD [Desulfuromonadales bacterium]
MRERKIGLRIWERNSTSAKMVIIGILALLLLIPAAMVERLIDEREGRKTSVTREIGSKWGGEQTVVGPMVRIPYLERTVNPDGRETVNRRDLYLLPNNLEISADVDPSTRYRGIYEAVVYSSQIRMTGDFDLAPLKQSGVAYENILVDEATILLGMTDMKGVRDQIAASVNGQAIEMNPGFQGGAMASSVGAPIPGFRTMPGLTFDFVVNLNGSGQLRFVPIGKTTRLAMASSWLSPSFDGAFLPSERDITPGGFRADWKILHFNRDLPQVWTCRDIDLEKYAFGVNFIIPADIYQQANRAAKYAILFIGFTFSAFFIAEILNCRRIHPVQYLLIGFALVLFYVLLISISEHLAFVWAYLGATVATIALISSYAVSVLGSTRLGLIVAAILAGLYSYMYVLLNLEDYSLLMGGLGLFIVLAAIMFLTRRIDWYAGAAEAG